MSIQDEMENLKEIVLKMGDKVVLSITEALDFYFKRIKTTHINDDLIDQYERLIEEECISILLKERVFAKDLKEVTGTLKLVSDIERIGDHAEDIVEFSERLENLNGFYVEGLEELAAFVIQMIKKAINAYITKNKALATEVIHDDDFVDKEYLIILNRIASHENYNNEYLLFAIYTTLVVKYLERVADHSVNIAEWVVYISTGYYKDKMIM